MLGIGLGTKVEPDGGIPGHMSPQDTPVAVISLRGKAPRSCHFSLCASSPFVPQDLCMCCSLRLELSP